MELRRGLRQFAEYLDLAQHDLSSIATPSQSLELTTSSARQGRNDTERTVRAHLHSHARQQLVALHSVEARQNEVYLGVEPDVLIIGAVGHQIDHLRGVLDHHGLPAVRRRCRHDPGVGA